MNIFRKIGGWFRPDKSIKLRTSEYIDNNIEAVEYIFRQKGRPVKVITWKIGFPEYKEAVDKTG